jgi:hypothetical protein
MSRLQNFLCALCVSIAVAPGATAQLKSHPVVKADPIMPLATSVATITATPSTISFTATNPDLGSVAGSSASTVSWKTTGGSSSSTWNLKVQAAATSFTNCATVPMSAVTVSCSSVTGGSSGACATSFALSTTAVQVASGKESTASNATYSVNLNFTLADSWQYIAKQSPSCTLTLTYTVTAP